jgi:hypothetical protein
MYVDDPTAAHFSSENGSDATSACSFSISCAACSMTSLFEGAHGLVR